MGSLKGHSEGHSSRAALEFDKFDGSESSGLDGRHCAPHLTSDSNTCPCVCACRETLLQWW